MSAATRLIIGCGYLGRQVTAAALARGEIVFATTRSKSKELAELGVRPIVADVLDGGSLKTLPETDFTLLAVGFDRSSGASMRNVYVDGLAQTLVALPESTRIVSVSSTGVYGQSDGTWVDESSPTVPTDGSGRVVLEAEQLLRTRRPDAVILRFAGIYGPGRLLRQRDLAAGKPIPGNPAAWLNLIHVVDGAAAVLAADGANPSSTYNVADGNPVARGDFFEEMARLIGAEPPRLTPGPAGNDRRIDAHRVQKELGFRPTFPSYREGLAASWGGRS